MMGIFYKTVFDISVFYAYAGFFFCYALEYKINPVSYCIFLVAALVLSLSEKATRNSKLFVIIAAVLPAVALLLETTTVGRLEVILLWAYFIYTVKQETYIIYFYHFLEKFKGFLVALIIPVIFVCFNVEAGIVAANMAIPYLLVFLATGVMTLQADRQRSAEESKKQFEKYQILQTILFFMVCILLTMSNLLQTFFDRIVQPVVKRVVFFFSNTLFRMIADLLKLAPEEGIHWHIDREGFEEELSMEDAAETFVEGNAWAEMIGDMSEVGENADMTQAFIYIGLVIGVFVLIALVGKAAKHSRVVALDVEREDLPEEDEPENRKKRKYFDPEKTVRRQYREFMKKAETREYGLAESDTTAEIKEKYKHRVYADETSAEQLTEVYRKVRYGGKKATKEDGLAMKSLVKKT